MTDPRSPIYRDETFVTMWLAIFLSAVSAFLLLMTLSALVFQRSGSAFMANVVVLTQWAPAVLALPLIRWLVGRHPARTVLVGAEIGGAALLLLLPAIMASYPALVAILLIRGTLESLSKVARTGAVKQYFSSERLSEAASYYTTANLVGGAVGALVGTVAFSTISTSATVLTCFALQAASAYFYYRLGTRRVVTPNALPRAAPIRLDTTLRMSILLYVASVAVFQGFHNVVRSVFPTEHLGLPDSGIPLIQAITNVAYIAGAFAAAKVVVEPRRYEWQGPTIHLMALLAMFVLPFVDRVGTGLSAYGLFAFLFEVAFCVHLRAIITLAPAEGFSSLVANVNAWSVGLMVATSGVASLLIERLGLLTVDLSYVCAATAVLLASLLLRWPTEAAVQKRPSRIGR